MLSEIEKKHSVLVFQARAALSENLWLLHIFFLSFSDLLLFKANEVLGNHGTDIWDWKCQSYDAAESNAGRNQVLTAHVIRNHAKELYTHWVLKNHELA